MDEDYSHDLKMSHSSSYVLATVISCVIERIEKTCVPFYESGFDKFAHACEASSIDLRFPSRDKEVPSVPLNRHVVNY